MEYNVQNRQSILDVAVQECGSLEAAFALSRRNNIALSDDLTAGQPMEISKEDIFRKYVVAHMSDQGAKPATAISAADKENAPWERGIGYLGIEIDFILL